MGSMYGEGSFRDEGLITKTFNRDVHRQLKERLAIDTVGMKAHVVRFTFDKVLDEYISAIRLRRQFNKLNRPIGVGSGYLDESHQRDGERKWLTGVKGVELSSHPATDIRNWLSALGAPPVCVWHFTLRHSDIANPLFGGKLTKAVTQAEYLDLLLELRKFSDMGVVNELKRRCSM